MKQSIWVYTVCWNEQHFVKQFLTAYKDAERIVVYDNMSTDNSRELLSKDPRVEIRDYNTNDQIRDDGYMWIKNNAWKEARGKADWVITVDFDEIFCNAWEINGKIIMDIDVSYADKLGFDIIKPYGYNMISLDAPLGADGHPFDYSRKGTRHHPNDKMCCFKPDKILEMNFYPGAHRCEPININGKPEPINICFLKQYKLLHYKFWNLEHYMERMAIYQTRMSQINKEHGWGWHYMESLEFLRNQFINGSNISKYLFDIE